MAVGLGRNNVRLGIPKVNQNPKAPTLKAALGNRARATTRQWSPKPGAAANVPSLGSAQAVSPAPAAPSSSGGLSALASAFNSPSLADDVKRAVGSSSALSSQPPAPTTNTNPFAAPAWNPKVAGEPDPRDAAYYQNLSKLQFVDQNEYNKILETQTYADSAYGSALQQAIQGRHVQERSLGESAIRSNLASSGWLDRTQGEQVRDYTQERANATNSKGHEDQERLAAKKALAEGFGIDAGGLLNEAAGRYAESQGKEAETGAPEYTPPVNGVGAPGTNTGAPGGKYGKWAFYRGPNELPGGHIGPGKPAKSSMPLATKAVKSAIAKAKKGKK